MINVITIQARFKVLTSGEGGKRKGYIKSGYRPNHIFEMNDDGTFKAAYIGEINLINRKMIYPDEEAIVNVSFLKVPELERYL